MLCSLKKTAHSRSCVALTHPPAILCSVEACALVMLYGLHTPRGLICSVRKTVHSRCYVALSNPQDIPAFKAAVEKQVFVTDRGAQFRWLLYSASWK